jgi:hypothetical protein
MARIRRQELREDDVMRYSDGSVRSVGEQKRAVSQNGCCLGSVHVNLSEVFSCVGLTRRPFHVTVYFRTYLKMFGQL